MGGSGRKSKDDGHLDPAHQGVGLELNGQSQATHNRFGSGFSRKSRRAHHPPSVLLDGMLYPESLEAD